MRHHPNHPVHSAERARVIFDLCLDYVGKRCGLPKESLLAPTRGLKQVADARHIAMYLVVCGFDVSRTQAGRLFGRDRTTISHGCSVVEECRERDDFDASICKMIAEIEKELAQ